jgi:nitrite reductase/ring-hydroxylating ferredoxin subunit
MTLKLAIEEAIYASAPDVTMLDVDGVVEQRSRLPASGIIPLEPVAASNRQAQVGAGWQPVDELASLGRGLARTIEVSGRPVLFCRVEEAFYAYSASCPACGQKLSAARLEAAALGCPACGQRFDVLRAGRGLDEPARYLQPFPLLIEHGQAQVALPV